jgi:D-sedoheptulose 7-phosphate isomerase
MLDTRTYFAQLAAVMASLPRDAIDRAEDALRSAWRDGRTIFLLGNGGSAATASHLVCDLAKGLVSVGQPRLRALALTDNVPLLTAYSNDVSYECVFAEQLASLARPGDVVVAISGSGNSPNVLAAVRTANDMGAVTIGLAGFAGGKLAPMVSLPVVVPSDNMQMIEDAHLAIGHALFTALRDSGVGPLSRGG